MNAQIRRTLLALVAALLLPATAAAQGVADSPPYSDPEFSMAMMLGIFVVSIVVMILVAALVIHGATEFAQSSVHYIRSETGDTGIVGFVAVVGTVIAVVAAMLLVFGIAAVFPPLAIVGILLALLVVVLSLLTIPANIVANIAVGHTLIDAVNGRDTSELDTGTLWVGFLVGFVVLAVVNFIPVVGFLVGIAVTSLGVGALVRYWRDGPYERPDGEDGWDGTSGTAGVEDEWGAGDPRDPAASGDEFGAPDDERAGWGSDDERDQWDDDSSKRDDSEEFW